MICWCAIKMHSGNLGGQKHRLGWQQNHIAKPSPNFAAQVIEMTTENSSKGQMKLSECCRKEARDFYLYDNKDCVEWKAADLLDECEKALESALTTPYWGDAQDEHDRLHNILAKLRGD